MKTIEHGEAEGCIILAHSTVTPTDAEWNAWLEVLGRYFARTPRPRLLVETAGGTPSPLQRRALDELSKPYYRETKVAVVTGSTFARGVVTPFRQLMPIYRAYTPQHIDAALDYLDVPASRFEPVKRRLEVCVSLLA